MGNGMGNSADNRNSHSMSSVNQVFNRVFFDSDPSSMNSLRAVCISSNDYF